MLSAALDVEIVLMDVLKEQYHFIPHDLIVKERLEGFFEMLYPVGKSSLPIGRQVLSNGVYLRSYEEVEKWR
jgi:hypothetical protein